MELWGWLPQVKTFEAGKSFCWPALIQGMAPRSMRGYQAAGAGRGGFN